MSGLKGITYTAEQMQGIRKRLNATESQLAEAMALLRQHVENYAHGNDAGFVPILEPARAFLARFDGADTKGASALACPVEHTPSSNGACPVGLAGHGGPHNMTWRKRKAGTGFYCDYCGKSEVQV